jgi:hypothetical protein
MGALGIQPLKSVAPKIFMSTEPAILLFVDGEAVKAPFPQSSVEIVVNANVAGALASLDGTKTTTCTRVKTATYTRRISSGTRQRESHPAAKRRAKFVRAHAHPTTLVQLFAKGFFNETSASPLRCSRTRRALLQNQEFGDE